MHRNIVRVAKRSLSRYEKEQQDYSVTGYALIMPGGSGSEIEELVAAGFNHAYIVGAEHDKVIYHNLVKDFRDSLNLYQGDIGDLMCNTRRPHQYTYVHLDFCGHFNADQLSTVQHWLRLPSFTMPTRLRLSCYRSRRLEGQESYEEELQWLLLHLCKLGFTHDEENRARWVHYYDSIYNEISDITRIFIALMLYNFVLNIDSVQAYLDEATLQPYLPKPRVTSHGKNQRILYRLNNIRRYIYNDPGIANHMATAWATLTPYTATATSLNRQELLNNLADVFEVLSHTVPPFVVNGNAEN